MAVMVSMMAMMMMYIHPWPIPSPLSNALLFSEDDSVGDIFPPKSTSTHPCPPSWRGFSSILLVVMVLMLFLAGSDSKSGARIVSCHPRLFPGGLVPQPTCPFQVRWGPCLVSW